MVITSGTQQGLYLAAQVLVGPDGLVHKAKITRSSSPALNKPALDAVFSWRFTPALENNEPIAFWVGIPIRFGKQE